MIKRKRRYALILGIIILLLGVGQAFADNIQDLKDKQDKIKDQIKDNQKQISNLQKQTKDISEEIKELDMKMNTASIELDKVEKELDKIEKEIEKTEVELDEAERDLEERDQLFKSRLRAMYMNGKVGYLELLLSSSSMKDFFTKREMIQIIAEYDNDLIAYMKDQRALIEEKKLELEGQRASVEVTRNKLKSRRDDLDKASRAKDLAMKRLESDTAALKAEQEKFNEEVKKVELEIIEAQRAAGENPYEGGEMLWPLPGRTRISSYFGYRIHPVTFKPDGHSGIDIPAPIGTSVRAAGNGTVIKVFNISSDGYSTYGNYLIIDHGGGIATLYAHNSLLVVSVGQRVHQGDVVAKSGNTGRSTGPHLHFEVRKNGTPVNPLPWVRGN